MLIQGRTGLKRVIPDCVTGRVLIQSNVRTGEPELHYLKLPNNIVKHDGVLLLDPQVSGQYPFTIIVGCN
jgi:uridine kinase